MKLHLNTFRGSTVMSKVDKIYQELKKADINIVKIKRAKLQCALDRKGGM